MRGHWIKSLATAEFYWIVIYLQGHVLMHLGTESCESDGAAYLVFHTQFQSQLQQHTGDPVPNPQWNTERAKRLCSTQVGTFGFVELWRHHNWPFPCKKDKSFMKADTSTQKCWTGSLQLVPSCNKTSSTSGIGFASYFKAPDSCRFYVTCTTSKTMWLFLLSTFQL